MNICAAKRMAAELWLSKEKPNCSTPYAGKALPYPSISIFPFILITSTCPHFYITYTPANRASITIKREPILVPYTRIRNFVRLIFKNIRFGFYRLPKTVAASCYLIQNKRNRSDVRNSQTHTTPKNKNKESLFIYRPKKKPTKSHGSAEKQSKVPDISTPAGQWRLLLWREFRPKKKGERDSRGRKADTGQKRNRKRNRPGMETPAPENPKNPTLTSHDPNPPRTSSSPPSLRLRTNSPPHIWLYFIY